MLILVLEKFFKSKQTKVITRKLLFSQIDRNFANAAAVCPSTSESAVIKIDFVSKTLALKSNI